MTELVNIGKPRKPSLHFGTSAQPNNRAAFAKAVIAVTSGKGGVGKSTVAANLAVSFAQRGLRVGILDADVYGPSLPRMLGLYGERLRWNDDDQMVPAENFGVRLMSTGMTTPEDDTPLAWRSSVATSAVVQLLEDVAWGELDVFFVDMPPGTGDVQITLAQEARLTCGVVVTTPQCVATDDVARALRMLSDVKVPAAIIENMSYFRAPDTRAVYHPFGEGGGERLAERYGVPLVGKLPLDPKVMHHAEDGHPVVAADEPEIHQSWKQIVDNLLEQPSLRDALAHEEP